MSKTFSGLLDISGLLGSDLLQHMFSLKFDITNRFRTKHTTQMLGNLSFPHTVLFHTTQVSELYVMNYRNLIFGHYNSENFKVILGSRFLAVLRVHKPNRKFRN